MEWKTPVFDRTQADVDFAIKQIAEWVALDISGAPYAAYDLKGCLNASDINRIEGNIRYLSEHLTQYGYTVNAFTKSWTNDGMPNVEDISRILGNVRELISSFYTLPSAPDVPSGMNNYNNVNAVEQNLHLIKGLLELMVESFRKAGAFQSGSTSFLPLRR